jgi:hypothetical protein
LHEKNVKSAFEDGVLWLKNYRNLSSDAKDFLFHIATFPHIPALLFPKSKELEFMLQG